MHETPGGTTTSSGIGNRDYRVFHCLSWTSATFRLRVQKETGMLERVEFRRPSAEQKHAYDPEGFAWPAAATVLETTCSPSNTSGSVGATVTRSPRLPVSGSVK